jgi:hypothetical protein
MPSGKKKAERTFTLELTEAELEEKETENEGIDSQS